MARKSQLGLSLIELMVALVAGLIVVGAVLSFVVTTLHANTQNTQTTRVMQELRTSMGLITRELRRAGYNQNAVDTVGSNTVLSTFTSISTNAADDCIVISYDRGGTAGTIDAGESRGFRRTVRGGVGLLQANLESNSASCTGSGWIDLTDPRTLDVTAFKAEPKPSSVSVLAGGTTATVMVRDIELTLTGQSTGTEPASRELKSRIRVRADCVDLDSATAPDLCPAP